MPAEQIEQINSLHAAEVERGERFEFGKNWTRFLEVLNDKRIAEAEKSLAEMLEVQDLTGKTFLDIGSGSGLFSLAARRLGATVFSFDYDANSVACTTELRRRYFPDDAQWQVETGSALDADYVEKLGKFDVVYSWGVLHHTGAMWQAVDNAQARVADGGKFFIALYNDTGSQAARWHWIKKTYNRLPRYLRLPFTAAVYAPIEGKALVRDILTLKPANYIKTWTQQHERGMNKRHDIIDWIGGFPYEYATPDEVFDFCRARGFQLTKLKSGNAGLGCNEFVFQKIS